MEKGYSPKKKQRRSTLYIRNKNKSKRKKQVTRSKRKQVVSKTNKQSI